MLDKEKEHTVVVYIRESLHRRLKILSVEKGVSLAHLVDVLIRKALEGVK